MSLSAAKHCGCNRDIARRVLLDAGLISSPRADYTPERPAHLQMPR